MDEELKAQMKVQMEQAIANVPQMVEGEYEDRFNALDTNKNGVLEYDEIKELFKEFCASGAPQGYVFTEENFAAKFKEWDLDGSGNISKDELKTIMIKYLTDFFKSQMAFYGM